MNFGHCRFVYNKKLKERINIYKKYKKDCLALRDYSFIKETQKRCQCFYQYSLRRNPDVKRKRNHNYHVRYS
ncbi:MAG: helix-turn-helix domain-containing protein [Candidatus Lokiarchaeota archaeon]|nr:helix-turn-helix domain-containing protein [Candidatus Lokiarchaeota archaeon]